MMFFMALFSLMLLAGIVLIVVWLVNRYRAPGGPGESPLDILKRRYAKGEISREEYERMRKDLSEERT